MIEVSMMTRNWATARIASAHQRRGSGDGPGIGTSCKAIGPGLAAPQDADAAPGCGVRAGRRARPYRDANLDARDGPDRVTGRRPGRRSPSAPRLTRMALSRSTAV